MNLMREGKDVEAINRFREVIDVAPNYANAWTNLALSFYKLEKFDSAKTYLSIANALNPYSPKTMNSLALTYYKLDEDDKAESLWREVLEIDPYNTEAYSWLLVLYELQDRQTDQKRIQKQLLGVASAPQAPLSIVVKAGQVFLAQRDFEAATEAYKQALAKGLDTAQVLTLQLQYPQLKVIEGEK
jgi:tetratricopeptide (TPR) repeat protein